MEEKELEERERRAREVEQNREQIRKRILDEAARKKARRDVKLVRKELRAEGLLPVSRRVYFRNDPKARKTTIEASGGIGGVQVRISSSWAPQLRRTIGLSLIRSMRPILQYLRDFEILHEGEMLSLPRLEERAPSLESVPDFNTEAGRLGFEIRTKRLMIGWTQQELAERASVNSRHLSEIELGRVKARPWTLQKIQEALATMFSDDPERDDSD
jgi:DNA-binding XRE family transcriptional regulator